MYVVWYHRCDKDNKCTHPQTNSTLDLFKGATCKMQMTQFGQSFSRQDPPLGGHIGKSHKMPKATRDCVSKWWSNISSCFIGKTLLDVIANRKKDTHWLKGEGCAPYRMFPLKIVCECFDSWDRSLYSNTNNHGCVPKVLQWPDDWTFPNPIISSTLIQNITLACYVNI